MNRLQANQQGPAGLQNTLEQQSMYSEILSMCPYVPCRNERNAVPNQEKKYVLVCTMDASELGNDRPGFGVHSISQKLSAKTLKTLLLF